MKWERVHAVPSHAPESTWVYKHTWFFIDLRVAGTIHPNKFEVHHIEIKRSHFLQSCDVTEVVDINTENGILKKKNKKKSRKGSLIVKKRKKKEWRLKNNF